MTGPGSPKNMKVGKQDFVRIAKDPEKEFVQDFLAAINQDDSGKVTLTIRNSSLNTPRPIALQIARTEAKLKGKVDSREISGNSGRIVINHSTHIPGLIAALQRLAETKGVSTIVPGRLYTAGGRQAILTIRVTVPTEGGFKMLARKGSQTQEVFIVTDLDRDTLEGAIAWSL